jgi:predicted nucleotidyltransferase
VLAVLVETTAELNLRTIAQLAGVSEAQASRVLPALVELGVVERREVPPASLFRLVPEHVAAPPLLALARSTDTALAEIGRMVGGFAHPPVSVIVFGSFARREAGLDSDIDVLVVRPADVGEDDDEWAAALEGWRSEVRRLTGTSVEVIEVSADEPRRRPRAAATCGPRSAETAGSSRASASMSSGAFAVPKPGRPKPVSAAQVRSYAAKAEEFAEAAVSDLAAGRNIAATSLAIHAWINSSHRLSRPTASGRPSRRPRLDRRRRARQRRRVTALRFDGMNDHRTSSAARGRFVAATGGAASR